MREVWKAALEVTQKLPNGQYVMSYEWVNSSGPNPARIRFSNDGINWGGPTNYGIPVKTASGAFLGATP